MSSSQASQGPRTTTAKQVGLRAPGQSMDDADDEAFTFTLWGRVQAAWRKAMSTKQGRLMLAGGGGGGALVLAAGLMMCNADEAEQVPAEQPVLAAAEAEPEPEHPMAATAEDAEEDAASSKDVEAESDQQASAKKDDADAEQANADEQPKAKANAERDAAKQEEAPEIVVEESGSEESEAIEEQQAEPAVPDDSEQVRKALVQRKIRSLDILLFVPKFTRKMRYAGAAKHCEKLDIDGVKGWRLPTIGELNTLAKARMLKRRGIYWSSTSADTYGDNHLALFARRKKIFTRSDRWKGGRAMCVRTQTSTGDPVKPGEDDGENSKKPRRK